MPIIAAVEKSLTPRLAVCGQAPYEICQPVLDVWEKTSGDRHGRLSPALLQDAA